MPTAWASFMTVLILSWSQSSTRWISPDCFTLGSAMEEDKKKESSGNTSARSKFQNMDKLGQNEQESKLKLWVAAKSNNKLLCMDLVTQTNLSLIINNQNETVSNHLISKQKFPFCLRTQNSTLSYTLFCVSYISTISSI